MMRHIILLLCFLLPQSAYAANRADLENCRNYYELNSSGKCVQALKGTSGRVASVKCKKDLNCWGQRYKTLAGKYCSNAFAWRAARSSFWNQYWSGQDFDQVRWLDRGAGVMVYYKEESDIVLTCVFNPDLPSRVRVRLTAPRK